MPGRTRWRARRSTPPRTRWRWRAWISSTKASRSSSDMALRPDTPGLYITHGDRARPGIVSLRTDVTGFVGIAERGPLRKPVRVETVRQFEAVFGGHIGGGYLAYAVRAFFENGGRTCL